MERDIKPTYDELESYVENLQKQLADAQATIAALEETILKMGENAAVVAKDAMAAKEQVAALQARVRELEAIKIPDDAFTYCAYCGEKSPVDEHNEDLAAHIKACPKHPMRDVESQLTQRTAELEAAKTRAHESESKATEFSVKLQQAREERDNLRLRIQAVDKEHEQLAVDRQKMTGTVESLLTERDNLRAELEALQREYSQLQALVRAYFKVRSGNDQNKYAQAYAALKATLDATTPAAKGGDGE